MDFSDYAEGLALFTAVTGGAGAGTLIVMRRLLPVLRGAPLALAAATVFTVWLMAVHLLPGVLGALERFTPALVALVSALLAWRLVPRSPRAVAPAPDEPPPSGALSLALATLGAGLVGAYLVAYLWVNRSVPVTAIDALTFHQPDVARWIQSGTFWQVDQFTPDLAHGNYPQNGNLVQLAAALPWRVEAFVRWTGLPYMLLACLSVYASALELRAPRATAVLAATAFGSLPVVLRPALEDGQVDVIMLAAFGSGVLFLLRHVRAGAGADLVLAGLALGIAFGTKWYGVSCVAALLAVWAAGQLLSRRPWPRVARDLAAAVGLVAAAGGFWLLRNWVESGNPLMPVRVAPAGITIFDAPPDPVLEAAGFTLLDYAGAPGIWADYILPAFRRSFELPGAALAAGALLAGVVWALRRGERRVPGLLVAALVLAVVYAITPYSALGPEDRPVQVDANTRYGMPALLVGAVTAAWGAGQLGRLRVVAELALLAAVLRGVDVAPDVPRGKFLVAALALAALGAAAWWLRGRELPRSRPLIAGLAVAGFAVVAVAGLKVERNYERSFYWGHERVIDAAIAAPEGSRIGLTGVWSNNGLSPVLPSFGPRLRNEVEYVGPWVRGVLRRHTDRASYTDALEAGGYDLVLVGRGFEPGADRPEEGWTRAAGWRLVAASPRLSLWVP